MRKNLGSLKSLTVQPVTRARYQDAKDKFYRWLDSESILFPSSPLRLDLVVSDYLEYLWASGKGRSEGSNLLASLQDTQPQLKGQLKGSWRLMKTWVTHEVPNRAPPFSIDHLHVLVGYCLFKGEPLMGLSLLLGFHALLRTGELLGLQARNVSVRSPKGPAVISLGLTKAGKRQGAAESVTVHSQDICRRLHQWVSQATPTASLTGPSHSWRKHFNLLLTAVGFDQADYRPYSLRRGGATHYFQVFPTFDKLLLLGRWQSSSTARIYVNEGLAVLTELRVPLSPFSRTLRSQYTRSLTQTLPKLERQKKPSGTKKPSQHRGRWMKAKKSQKRMCHRGGQITRVKVFSFLGSGRKLK